MRLRPTCSLALCALWAGAASAAPAAPAPGGRPGDLQARIDAASPGDVVDLGGGDWAGPATIDKRLVLRHGVIDGRGTGSALVVKAPGVVIEGVTVHDSGKDLGGPDACIWLEKAATGAEVRGSTVRGCAFGIWVNEAAGAHVIDNRVIGTLEGSRSDRGNGIQLFNASRLVVERNVVTGGRDGIYVSATTDSVIAENRISDARYGVHYMFSYRNTLRGNESRRSVGGFALMESREIQAIGNVATDNTEHGILFRDAQYCTIEGNRLERNGEGLFFFSSTENKITRNVVVGNGVGVKIWAGSLRNVVSDNVLVNNKIQVFYVGVHDLVVGHDRPGNYWSDYLGWDQNGDGVGDRPYRVDSFTTGLIHRFPAAALLLRSPALELLAHLEESMPILRTPTLVDEKPLMRRPL